MQRQPGNVPIYVDLAKFHIESASSAAAANRGRPAQNASPGSVRTCKQPSAAASAMTAQMSVLATEPSGFFRKWAIKTVSDAVNGNKAASPTAAPISLVSMPVLPDPRQAVATQNPKVPKANNTKAEASIAGTISSKNTRAFASLLTASEPAPRPDNHRTPAASSGPASRPRRISSAGGRGDTWYPPAPRAARS